MADSAAAVDIERTSRVLLGLSLRALDGVAGAAGGSTTSLRALLILDELGECSLGRLAEGLGQSQSACSRMVNKLVLAGMVDRRAAPQDRRRVRLRATAAGRRAACRLVRLRRAAIADIAGRLSATDLECLERGLVAFAAAATASAPPAPT